MIYRCRACQYEEARGCLPAVTCGLYLVFLIGLTIGCIGGVFRVVLSVLGPPAEPVEPIAPPWWLYPVSVLFGFLMVAIGVVVTSYTLELVEWLIFARRRCPTCGARRWSWGYTRGFGL